MSNSFLKKASYTVLDWITFGKGVPRIVNGMKVRFPARWGRYYGSEYEADTYSLLKDFIKPGSHIMDIGAHIGLFSVCCSQLCGKEGRVVCFEPTPGTFAILKNTLKLNHCGNVTAIQAAVSDKDGTATFYVSNANEGCNSNSLIETWPDKHMSGYDVKLITIDTATAGHAIKPSLIKIDVEGAELDALKGGVETFRNFKPVIILGLHPAFIKQKGDSMEAIWELLRNYGYRVTMEEKPMSKEEFCTRDLLFDVHCYPS